MFFVALLMLSIKEWAEYVPIIAFRVTILFWSSLLELLVRPFDTWIITNLYTGEKRHVGINAEFTLQRNAFFSEREQYETFSYFGWRNVRGRQHGQYAAALTFETVVVSRRFARGQQQYWQRLLTPIFVFCVADVLLSDDNDVVVVGRTRRRRSRHVDDRARTAVRTVDGRLLQRAGRPWLRGRRDGDRRRRMERRRAADARQTPGCRRRRRWREGLGLALSTADGAEYSAVEDGHDDARDVEGRHRRVDEKVGVVEGAQRRMFASLVGVVDSEYDRWRDGRRYDPRGDDRHQYSSRVLVTSVR